MSGNHPPQKRLRILVTGAAGLIGSELCHGLADRGHAVVGLLRRRGTPSARLDAISPRLIGGAIVAIQGDVAAPGLGLTPRNAAWLAEDLDVVVHCAAVTGFSLPPETYDQVNTGGTQQVLAFTSKARVPLLHVSTAYVCGDVSGAVREAPAAAGPFHNGYEASKAAAEALVWQARDAGQIAAVARPSIVVGRWADGATRVFGVVYQLIRLVAEGRIRTLPADPGASLDLVPLDHVVGGLIDIAERMADANGRIFHLASGCPVPLGAIARLAGAFPQFHAPSFVRPRQFNPASLGPRERRLHEQVVEAYAAYLRPSPHFATANLPAFSGRCCPPMDAAFLHRMIAFAVAAGFLPRGPVSEHRDNAGPALVAARSPS